MHVAHMVRPAKKVVYTIEPSSEPNAMRCANRAARAPRAVEPAAVAPSVATSAAARNGPVFQDAGITQACGSQRARPASVDAGFVATGSTTSGSAAAESTVAEILARRSARAAVRTGR